MPVGHATVTGATANMTMIDQLTEHDRIELLARAQDAWDRAPQNTMRAVFEWRGKNYVVSLTRRFSCASTVRKASRSAERMGADSIVPTKYLMLLTILAN